jgi:serine/threonine protein kinase/Tol biopolymer transport system component
MSLNPGSRLGPYEITTAIGAGGMGEVFRARDTRLDRDVAIKVLPSEWAQDRERLARFEREAKLLASLNHANIAHVYGFESAALPDGTTAHFLAMELVEGEDLAERLKSGAIPIDEAIAIARQLAEGLEEAHGSGIIHRDLKPANIKVTAQGKVKILDFGLAKALEGDASTSSANSQLSRSPTISRHMTEAGMILGTAAYMSPEQARGKPLDKRTDIWAFGVVLYEILAGRRAFTGDDVTEVLASVIRDAPDLTALPAGTPEPIRRLLRRCLEKDRHERLPDISAARLEIKDALSGSPEMKAPEAATSPRERRLFGMTRASAGLTLLCATLAVALAVSLATRPETRTAPPGVIRFPVISDPRIRIATGSTTPFAISPDGNTIVFSGSNTGRIHLWARTFDEPEARIIPDTEGGQQPAISPDGEWVAFVSANHVIRKVRMKGGGASVIASINDTTASIAWGLNDDIVFELIGSVSGIQRVSANGGKPELLIPLDGAADEVRQRRPFVLRADRRVLYASSDKNGATALCVFSPDDGRRVRLPVEGIQALGVIDGELIYSRADGALMAIAFDARAMQVRGTARQLAERVAASGVGTAVAMSPGGTLVFRPTGAQASRFMLRDAEGRTTPLGNWVRPFSGARFSPDGNRVAVVVAPGGEGEGLWVIDRTSAEPIRVAGAEGAALVDWTRDGRAILSLRDDGVWITPVDGSQPARLLVGVAGVSVSRGASRAPDGRSMVVVRRPGGSMTQELVLVSLDPGKPPVTIVPPRSAGGSLLPAYPRISPDGKWVAFVDETVSQVHVRSLSGTASIQVSDESGGYALWGPREGQLFYGFDGLVEADLAVSPLLTVRRRQRVETWSSGERLVDISADGKTFLINQATTEGPQALVALHWGASLARRPSGQQD